MLPKQTLLQNKTLAIQVLNPILSMLIKLSYPELLCKKLAALAFGEGAGAGESTRLGLMLRETAVPARPTTEERMNPGFDRSTRYHSTGLTNANVNETCSVDCHGRRRYNSV